MLTPDESAAPSAVRPPGPVPAPPRAAAPAVADRSHAVAAALDALSDRPLAEHADVYQGLHQQLQADLAEIDSA